MLNCEVSLVFQNEKSHDIFEMFNLTNKECQANFKNFTFNTNVFSKCFVSEESINIQINRWKRKLNKALHACFRKIRINNNKVKTKSRIDTLMQDKNNILKKIHREKDDMDKVDEIDKIIREECQDKEMEKLQNVIGSLDLNNGGTNNTNIWKQMKKAFPSKTRPIPTGVMNKEGKVITNPIEKKNVKLEHFKNRMRNRPVKEEVKDVMNLKKNVI